MAKNNFKKASVNQTTDIVENFVKQTTTADASPDVAISTSTADILPDVVVKSTTVAMPQIVATTTSGSPVTAKSAIAKAPSNVCDICGGTLRKVSPNKTKNDKFFMECSSCHQKMWR
jgi:hypothetical protein